MDKFSYMRANRLDCTMTKKEIKEQFARKYDRLKCKLGLCDLFSTTAKIIK